MHSQVAEGWLGWERRKIPKQPENTLLLRMSFAIEKQGLEKTIRPRPSALKIIPTSEQPQTTHSNWETLLKKGGILTGKNSILP